MVFTGPDRLSTLAVLNTGSFFYNRPTFFLNGATRWAFAVGTKTPGVWRLHAFKRTNPVSPATIGTWAEADAANAPQVCNSNSATGFSTVAIGGYTAGSGVLDVLSTVGDPAFVGAPPFNVVVGNPFGTFFAQLTVTGINSPTQFAVVPFGADTNAPAGTGVFQVGAPDPFNTPFACPTYLQDPLDPTKVIAAYASVILSLLSFCPFDMSAGGGGGAWGAEVTGGPRVYGVDLVFDGSVSSDDTGAKVCIGYRATDNKFVFNFQGQPEALLHNCLRPNFVTYDRAGLSFGVAAVLAGAGEDQPYEAHGILVDPDDGETYCTVVKPTNGPSTATYEIWLVAVDPDDTINPKELITNNVARTPEPLVSYPVLRPAPHKELMVFYIREPVGDRRAAVSRAVPGIAPAWAEEIISTSPDNSPIGDDFITPSGGIGPDGFPYLFWIGAINATFAYTLWFSKGGNAGDPWAAPAALLVTDPNAGDFMEFPTVSPLPGLGFGIGVFDFQQAASEFNAYFELLFAEPPPEGCNPDSLSVEVPAGWFPARAA
jgi:hypothetical protein